MTLYDSSVLIDYLDGKNSAVDFVNADQSAVAPQLVLFEVYQGEVFKSGPTDLDAVDGALSWLTVLDETNGAARAAAVLQDELRQHGKPLAARDAFIAGTAIAHDELLAVSDSDFDVDGVREYLHLEFVE